MAGEAPRPKQYPDGYPSPWSEWKWKVDMQLWESYRKVGPGKYDYEFDRQPPEGTVTPKPARALRMTSSAPTTAFPTALSGSPSTPQTPAVPLAPPRQIHTKDHRSKVEELDKNFRVHKSKDFEFGRIFKVLWAEPRGSHGTEITIRSPSKFGEAVFQKIRRFLILKNNIGHSTCLPILTYGGQGTLKPGVYSSHHAAIYSSKYKEPYILPGENLSKHPIMMNFDREGETLDPLSRINYAKVYTVEHNVKVYFVGRIASRDLEKVVFDYNSTHTLLPQATPTTTYGVDLTTIKSPKPTDLTITSRMGPPNRIVNQKNTVAEAQVSSFSETRLKSERRESFTSSSRAEDSTAEYDEDKGMKTYSASLSTTIVASSSKSNPVVNPAYDDYTRDYIFDDHDRKRWANFEQATDRISIKNHGFDENDTAISISSSEESLPSLFSHSSSATSSTITEYGSYKEGLRDLLLQDDIIRSVLDELAQKMPLEKFERKVKRSLDKFADHLKTELSFRGKNTMVNVTKIIRKLSRETASSIRDLMEQDQNIGSKKKVPTSMNPYLVLDLDESGSSGQDEIDIDAGTSDEINFIESTLLQTNSFIMLQHNLRLSLNPDHVERAVFEAWPGFRSIYASTKITYLISWEIPDFLSSRALSANKLGQLLTITGDGSGNAQALSCEEYITRTWPSVGFAILEGTKRFLDTSDGENSDDPRMTFSNSNKQYDTGLVSFTFHANYLEHVKAAAALSWISASFRSPSTLVAPRSMVSITPVSKNSRGKGRASHGVVNHIEIVLKELKPAEKPQACWHSLFAGCVVAEGFPIRERSQGMGLEICFADMAVAGRCLSFVEYDRGLIAHGLSSMLIPMKELKEDKAIQWHFEDKTKQKHYSLASLSQILRVKKIDQWYMDLDPKKLFTTRCFLGYANEGYVAIGTSNYSSACPRSEAEKSTSGRRVNSYNFAVGTDILGLLSGKVTIVNSRVCSQTHIVSSQRKDIYDILGTARDHYIFLYDNGEKIGWCIPKMSFVLQMSHLFVSELGYQFYNGDTIVNDTSEMFAQLSPDAVGSSYDALKRCFKYKVRKDEINGHPVDEDFKDIIEKSWHTLNDIGDSLAGAESDFLRIGNTTPRYIHGVEYIDAVNRATSIPIRVVEVNQPWAQLTKEEPTVIFSRDISQAIVAEGTQLCKSWETVPSKKNYLVSMGYAAHSFLARRASGLVTGVSWLRQGPLIQSHNHNGDAPVYHTQSLRSTNTCSLDQPTKEDLQAHLRSVFIFGGSGDRKCHDKPKNINKSIIINTTPAKLQDQPPPSLPSSASNTSGSASEQSGLGSSLGDIGAIYLTEIDPSTNENTSQATLPSQEISQESPVDLAPNRNIRSPSAFQAHQRESQKIVKEPWWQRLSQSESVSSGSGSEEKSVARRRFKGRGRGKGKGKQI